MEQQELPEGLTEFSTQFLLSLGLKEEVTKSYARIASIQSDLLQSFGVASIKQANPKQVIE
jgi:hypothetical protein